MTKTNTAATIDTISSELRSIVEPRTTPLAGVKPADVRDAVLSVLMRKHRAKLLGETNEFGSRYWRDSEATKFLVNDVREQLGFKRYGEAGSNVVNYNRVRNACIALEKTDQIENCGRGRKAEWRYVSDDERAQRQVERDAHNTAVAQGAKAREVLALNGIKASTSQWRDGEVTLSAADALKLAQLLNGVNVLANDLPKGEVKLDDDEDY